ncbi:MAG: hypothetical protein QJR03_15085 [Sphaerobacter sp.]|nr:hypothetical protein [Sphaerobacter sp.]
MTGPVVRVIRDGQMLECPICGADADDQHMIDRGRELRGGLRVWRERCRRCGGEWDLASGAGARDATIQPRGRHGSLVRPYYGGVPLRCPACGAPFADQVLLRGMHRAPLVWHGFRCSLCGARWWFVYRDHRAEGLRGRDLRRWRRMAAAWARRPDGGRGA